MSEDLKVSQRPSATPYVLGGGLAGAAIGGVATQFGPGKSYVTEAPKYKTHEDLVKAAEDKFENVVNEVEKFSEVDKSFSDKVKAQQENIKKAGEQYDADLAKYLEEGKKQVVAVDTDEIKELNKQLEAAKSKLVESEKALVNASPKELVVKPNRLDVIAKEVADKETNIKAQKKVLELKENIAELTEKLELAKNKTYLEQRQKGLEIEIKNLSVEIEKMTNGTNDLTATTHAKLEKLLKDYENKVVEYSNLPKKDKAISIPKANIISDYPKLVEGMQKNEAILEEIKNQRKDLIQKLAKDPNSADLQKELANLAKKEEGIRKVFEQQKAKVYNPENLTKEMQAKLAKYNAQESFINDKLDDYARKASQASKKEGGTERCIKDGLANLRDDIFGKKGADGKVVKEGLVGLSNSEKEAVFNQAKEQFNDRIALFDRIHGDELKLNELKQEYGRFSETRRKIFDQHTDRIKANIDKATTELENSKKMLEVAEQRKKHIQKMWNARKEAKNLDGKKVVDATFGDMKTKEFKYTSFSDTLDDAQKGLLKEYQQKTKIRAPKVVKTTPATEGLAAAVENNKSKVSELTSQIAKKREALPKQPAKTVEELTADFVKKNGTKEASVKEATTKAVNELKDDVAGWLEKATKTNGKKIAWIAAGTALAGAILALALRPSAKEA